MKRAAALESTWPSVLGVLGIVYGGLAALKRLVGILWIAMWADAAAVSPITAGVTRVAISNVPQVGWIVTTHLVWLGLSVVLIVGSLEILRQHRAGVPVCRVWAWLAIGWATVESVIGYWWLATLTGFAPPALPAGWLSGALSVAMLALLLRLAFPILLLAWLSRPAVRTACESWSD